jgi:hypothetical protein
MISTLMEDIYNREEIKTKTLIKYPSDRYGSLATSTSAGT